MVFVLRSALVALALLRAALGKPAPGYHPVVVAGPLLGQNLEIKNMDDGSWCNTKDTWQWLWGNPSMIRQEVSVAKDIVCLLEGLELVGWDAVEKLAIPKPKVQVRPKGGFENSGLDAISTFFGGPILEGGSNESSHLWPRLRRRGYVADKSFFGHGYDWRLGVGDWQVSSFPVFRRLIENATRISGSAAVLTGISMAGPYIHAFLSWARAVDPAWPARHVHAFVPVAAPFNGAVMALSAVVSSALQTWSTDGECPRCDPPKPKPTDQGSSDSLIEEFKDWMQGGAKKIGDEVIKKLIWNWPSMYWMSTGIDYSTEPPTDPLVATMLNGEVPAQCGVEIDTATSCGATQTREGWAFDNTSYLAPTQCAECYKTSKLHSCTEGFDQAYNGWVQQLCCKRHQCNMESYRASQLPNLLRKVGRQSSASMMEYALSVPTTRDPGVPVHCIFTHNVQTFSRLAFATNEEMKRAQVTLDDGDQTVDAASLEVCTRWKSTVKVYRVPGVKHTGALDIAQILDVIEAVSTGDERKWMEWREPAMSELQYSTNTSLAAKQDLLISRAPVKHFII